MPWRSFKMKIKINKRGSDELEMENKCKRAESRIQGSREQCMLCVMCRVEELKLLRVADALGGLSLPLRDGKSTDTSGVSRFIYI